MIFNKSRLNLTQTSMAHMYKNRDGESITQGAIGHFLNGRTALNARACTLFSEALQVPLEEFAPASVLKELELLADRRHDDYIEVAHYDRRFSGGAGATDGESEERLLYRRDWLHKHGVQASDLTAVDVVGDSMAPQIRDGDTLLIRRDLTEIESGMVYAFDHGTEQRVKRVYRKSRGIIVLASDNPDYPGGPEVIKAGDLNEIKIIGLVWQRAGPVT